MNDTSAFPELSLRQKIRGHVGTLRPFLSRTLRPPPRPATTPWSHEFSDDTFGPVTLTGRYLDKGTKDCIVAIHGLGGSTDSGYMALVLAAAERAGRSCLLLNCRGADRLGAGLYHSGLAADVGHALGCAELAAMEAIDLFGYSIGGHIALKYASETVDGRLRRVAAVGSPLDLAAAADDFDASGFNVYRGHVLDSLKEIYTAAYQRRPRGLLPVEARRIKKIRDWDDAVIAPYFGFGSASHYYETQSVGPVLTDLKVEALYVGATCDPMVRLSSVAPHLDVDAVEVIWDDRAGHLGFSPDFDMHRPAPRGLEHQVLAWLAR